MRSITLSEELKWRGFVNQTTLKDVTELDGGPMTFYWGVDPSADSMHIGQLAMSLMIRHFIEHGHTAILLVGGATGLIGDPDGKSEERELKSVEEVEANKHAITAQYKKLFAGQDFKIVDNYDWFKEIGYLEFLREVGKHVPMRQMLGREFVQTRLGEQGAGISYAEFSYSLIQGYDFLHLYRKHGVRLQVCGSDQWGNSIAGVELIRRIESAEAHVWSAPLVINKATGVKFGKSEEGAVWLDEAKTSVYQFYQFWLNVDDDSVLDYLKLYTFLSKDEVEKITQQFENDKASRVAQKTLAYEVTKLAHGSDRADAVRRVSEALFGTGDYSELQEDDFSLLETELTVVNAPKGAELKGLLIESGLASSNSEAQRFLAQGAVYVNGHQVSSDNHKLEDADILQGGNLVLRRGKNSNALIKVA